MERLTTRCAGHAVMAWEHEEKLTTQEWIDLLTDRLAAYEDTGLEPEELAKIKKYEVETKELIRDLNSLMAYRMAEQEGRLVVLPCKVGDTVFDIFGGSVKEETIVYITFLISQSVKHMTIHAENHRGAITELELLRFGKTWFLTREEAEAALERMKEGKGDGT